MKREVVMLCEARLYDEVEATQYAQARCSQLEKAR